MRWSLVEQSVRRVDHHTTVPTDLGTISRTNGTSSSRPSGGHGEDVVGGQVQHRRHDTDGFTAHRHNGQSFEFVVVELVRVVAGIDIGGVDDEQCAPQFVGGGTSRDFGQR